MNIASNSIYICPVRLVSDVLRQIGARHLVSAIDGPFMPSTPEGIAPERHLKLEMHDVVEANGWEVLPAIDHVKSLLKFAESWDGSEPMLIHCYAGISRSTAAALTVICARHPDESEIEIAQELRRVSPTAQPNALFVKIADEVLGRKGRMVSAVEAMAPKQSASACIPFSLSLPRLRNSRAA